MGAQVSINAEANDADSLPSGGRIPGVVQSTQSEVLGSIYPRQ